MSHNPSKPFRVYRQDHTGRTPMAEEWRDGRLIDPDHPGICVHHVGTTPGMWCGACTPNHPAITPVQALPVQDWSQDGVVYSCSYCTQPAKYVGDGQDGDFYCTRHMFRAPGPIERI